MEFEFLKSHVPQLEVSKNQIVLDWVEDERVSSRLRQNGISPKFFARHFGGRVLEYAIGVVKDEMELGDCPVIHVLLQLFREKNIPLHDIFIICAGLKNTLLQTLLAQEILTPKTLDEVAHLMDANFEGVMSEYLDLEYGQRLRGANQQMSNSVYGETLKTQSAPLVPVRILISATEYLSSVSVDTDDLDEMRELEDDAIVAMANDESLHEEGKDKLIRALVKYAYMLNSLLEFEKLGYSLNMLAEVMSSTNISALPEQTKRKLPIFCKAIIEDLQGWRVAVLETHEAKDIHWMDDGFLSSISQLQVMLMPQANDEDELELF
jgi:hypothetical protein